MGAESIMELLQAIDLEKDSEELKAELVDATGQKRARIIKRLEVVESFRESGNRPEWMIMTVIPVIPPDLRPGGSWTGDVWQTSDLNDLQKDHQQKQPSEKDFWSYARISLSRNEKMALQEARF